MQSHWLVAAALLAILLLAALACDGGESVPLRVERAPPATAARVVEGERAPPERVARQSGERDAAAPVSAPAAVATPVPVSTPAPILTPVPGGPLVECQVSLGGDRMQANASWANLPAEQGGAGRIGYDYIWHHPARDGSYSENRFRLTGEHQGTSLLGQAIPAGATLEFSVRPVFAEGLAGDYLRVQCAEVVF